MWCTGFSTGTGTFWSSAGVTPPRSSLVQVCVCPSPLSSTDGVISSSVMSAFLFPVAPDQLKCPLWKRSGVRTTERRRKPKSNNCQEDGWTSTAAASDGKANSWCWSQSQLLSAALRYFYDSEFGKKSPGEYRLGVCWHGYKQKGLWDPSLSCPASLCWPGVSLRSDNDNCDQLFSRRECEQESGGDGQILEPLVPLFIPLVRLSSVTAVQGLRRPERCLWGFFLTEMCSNLFCSDKMSISEERGDHIRHLERKRFHVTLSWSAANFPFAKPSHTYTLMDVHKESRRVERFPPELTQRCGAMREQRKYASTYRAIWSGYKAISSSAASRYRLWRSFPFHLRLCITQRLRELHLYLQANISGCVEGEMLLNDWVLFLCMFVHCSAQITKSCAVSSAWP